MPTDYTISLAAKRGVDRILAGGEQTRAHSMRGFDPQYVDIVDYIVRITHRIWEEKDIGYIYDTYSGNARVTNGWGLHHGRDATIEETIAAIAEAPDLRLHADEVIWAGDDEQGFRTSHRVFEIGHHTGHGLFGAPTGRKFAYWAIANCVVIANEIVEEWVLSDTFAMLRQLGLDPFAIARSTTAEQPAAPPLVASEAQRGLGQARPADLPFPHGGSDDPRAFERWLHHQIWNRRNLSAVERAYAETVRIHAPRGRDLYGRGDAKGLALELLLAFPDLMGQVDDVYWMGNSEEGQLVATRWSIVGTHRGPGTFGPPTGGRAYLWGITQHLIRDGRIVEEWTVANDFEVLCRLLAG